MLATALTVVAAVRVDTLTAPLTWTFRLQALVYVYTRTCTQTDLIYVYEQTDRGTIQ